MIRVAIDGPAGVGKSSTSKALAKYFGYAYLDTGAMYRACAWWCLKQDIDLDAETVDERVITEAVGEFFTGDHFDISVDPDNPRVFADDEDISEAIRSSEVSSHVSKVSNVIPVRNVLIAAQRAYIAREASADSFSGGLGIVAEGRDITTVVSPDAEVRVLLTAREEVRQARRTGQAVKGVGAEDVAARDKADSKVTSFLTAADGVTTIDNSDLDFAHTLDLLIGLVEDAIENQEYEQYAANLEGYELDEGDEDLISGRGFTEGARKAGPKPVGVLAVVGRPNVGKSSLVNRILGRRAAVVEDTPGVTRDRVSYDAEWAGTDFKLVDTGGWEADVEGIESAIASQAQVAVTLADAVVFVVDGQVGMTTTDERIVKMLRAAGKPVVLAVNKIDDQGSEYLAAEFWKPRRTILDFRHARQGSGRPAGRRARQAQAGREDFRLPHAFRPAPRGSGGPPERGQVVSAQSAGARRTCRGQRFGRHHARPRRRNRQHRWRGLAVHRHRRHQATPAQAHRRGILFLSAHAGRHRAL